MSSIEHTDIIKSIAKALATEHDAGLSCFLMNVRRFFLEDSSLSGEGRGESIWNYNLLVKYSIAVAHEISCLLRTPRT